ncbi:16S rRNA (cytidine(1402)-2'-O)-methyltransferase [Cloacibacillus sp. An23]|uniref:16S rRNA (cytidine(1402)-2'-O)-methyltransferase n=1 Tax=Cloacibacillus sp. An23 TaxID=1965591 RepID=UPI000B3A7E51|nr:16S rRNA (cytidine(1402)-2'-O)-methyltransferase [Cloacibacillus sp. An23]OUO91867.1 16S rRNA (cytidine(1402)-2'-O)-methyltransferase [Cloacibacillus sp. An23]
MPLIVIPTPVGNLGDMTLRGLEELRAADVIACEDTRHTLRLLNHFGIKKPLLSCHEHNERERAAEIMRRVEAGERVALVSDAGTPGLSDPGAAVVRAAIERGLPFDVLPGANALLPALLIAGIGMESFVFVGFLKGKKDEKFKRLAELKNLRETLVFYAAPHHLKDDLALMAQSLGDRRAVLVREISKIHQERIEGTLASFCDTMPEDKIRGEFVCVVEGASEETPEADGADWREEAAALVSSGVSTKAAAEEIASRFGVQKNSVKKFIIENCIREA